MNTAPKQYFASAAGAHQIARHSREQQPADGNLPLLHTHAVAGDRQRNRENAARGDARDYAQGHQHFKVRGQAAGNCGYADNEHAHRNEPCLAEHVRQRAKHRLDEGIRQSEPGREQRRSGRRDVQSRGDLRDDRIDRPHEKRRRKNDERHEIEDTAHEN